MFLIRKKWTIFSPWDKSKEIVSQFSSMENVFNLKGEIISRGSQSEIFFQEISGKRYFVKRYFRSKNIGSWLGFSRFSVESKNQLWFNKLGISAARVVVCGEESLVMKTHRGVLITEGIDDVLDLATIVRNEPEKFNHAAWRDNVIVDLAKIVRTLHQHQFCHNDLHWRNILVQQANEQLEPKIFLIDCPSGKRLFWPFLYYRKLKDLASLDKLAASYLTRTQRLRFYLEYRQIEKLASKDKIMIKGIFVRKASRLKRKQKRAL